MPKTKGSKAGEVLDVETGAKNLADNLAKEAQNMPEVIETESTGKKRGRKASNHMTFAKFSAAIKDGGIPDGVKYVATKEENGRVVVWGHFEVIDPVMQLDEEGNLTLIRLYTEGRKNTPAQKVLKTVPAAKVAELLASVPDAE